MPAAANRALPSRPLAGGICLKRRWVIHGASTTGNRPCRQIKPLAACERWKWRVATASTENVSVMQDNVLCTDFMQTALHSSGRVHFRVGARTQLPGRSREILHDRKRSDRFREVIRLHREMHPACGRFDTSPNARYDSVR